MNPVTYLKNLWADRKKRPWILAGAGATGAAAYLTMRGPAPGPDAAAEDAAAEAAAPPPGGAPGTYGAEVAGGGMHGVYVSSPPMDYDAGFEEMDFSPLFEAIEEQGLAFEDALAQTVAAERQTVATKVRPIRKSVKQLTQQNKRQQAQINRQKKTNRQQRKALARVKRRAKGGPSKKKKKGGRG